VAWLALLSVLAVIGVFWQLPTFISFSLVIAGTALLPGFMIWQGSPI
jgi:hypothetical protein